jgi:hypothetical protein
MLIVYRLIRRIAYAAHISAAHLYIWAEVKCCEYDWDSRAPYWTRDEL